MHAGERAAAEDELLQEEIATLRALQMQELTNKGWQGRGTA